jgi:hypothetical protein
MEPLMYTLGTAAKAAGVSKSTIHRAIKRGTISARSKGEGGYEIDPAELHRVFPPVSSSVPENTQNGSSESSLERYATPPENAGTLSGTPVPRDHELEVKLARAEAQLESLKEVLDLERKRAEELKLERDKWSEMAQASQRQLVDLTAKPQRGFLRWLKGG